MKYTVGHSQVTEVESGLLDLRNKWLSEQGEATSVDCYSQKKTGA